MIVLYDRLAKEKAEGVQPEVLPIIFDFRIKEHADEAFMKMLEETGITHTWKWEDVAKKAWKHPFYLALKTFYERKERFERFATTEKLKEQV